MTKVYKCTCTHSYQDSVYGKDMRLFNECTDGKKIRCTVCGKEINLSGDKK